MAAEESADLTDGSRAGQFFQAESRHSTLSPWRKVRSFLANLMLSAFAGPATWPPVDIVLVDLSSSLVVRRWHAGGEEAAGLFRLLSDDLTSMHPTEFIDKWDVPVE